MKNSEPNSLITSALNVLEKETVSEARAPASPLAFKAGHLSKGKKNLDAEYKKAKKDVDAKIKKLQSIVNDHEKSRSAGNQNWGLIGDLKGVAESLDDIISAF